MTVLLAFDTATEAMNIGLANFGQAAADRTWIHQAAGGAQASAALIPAIFGLLAEAGLELRDVDAIAFGRGPGAFTGLRTACSVAQGLALGAARPVLPIDTLLAVAEDARADAAELRVWAVMDARMDEIYAAQYRFEGGDWQVLDAPLLSGAPELNRRWRDDPPELIAGNALAAYGARLEPGPARRVDTAMPRAAALLSLARRLWLRGGAVDPALALPLYVRDKVAQTTAEREQQRAAAASGSAAR